jgi:hypothetical protein
LIIRRSFSALNDISRDRSRNTDWRAGAEGRDAGIPPHSREFRSDEGVSR